MKYLAYGLESGAPAVNRAINKRIDLRQFEETIRLTRVLKPKFLLCMACRNRRGSHI